jgi:hypothetical protein
MSKHREKYVTEILTQIVIFVLSAQNDCFLLAHENEFLVETLRSKLQTKHTNKTQSFCALNTK